jgi:exosortase
MGVSTEAWARVGVIAALFAAVFWPNLRRLWLKTNPFTGEANWSHAVVVPIIGLYYLYLHREELARAGARQFIWGPILRPSRLVAAAVMVVVGGAMTLAAWKQASLMFTMILAVGEAIAALGVMVALLDWSLASIVFGLAVFVYGIYPGQNDYLKDLGMVITLFGMVLLLSGPAVMKIAWFPIAFLVCAIPWPGLVYSWVAEPLQTMAAAVAVDVLKLCNVLSVTSGTKIVIFNPSGQPPRVLNVAEACAGMRSLMTFIAVGGAIAFLTVRPLWQRLIIVVSAVPIAIFCNVMRISGQGLLDHYVSPQWSESFAHQFVGMMMLLPAFFLILLVAYLLDQLFIEEAEEGEAAYPAKPMVAAAIGARDSAIPALGTISAIAAPAVAPAAQPRSVVPPAVAPPVTPAPATLASAPSATARSSVPPRPVMPANRPPAAAPRVTPPRPVGSGLPPRMPAPPVRINGVAEPARKPVQTPVPQQPAVASTGSSRENSQAAAPPVAGMVKPANARPGVSKPGVSKPGVSKPGVLRLSAADLGVSPAQASVSVESTQEPK